MDEMIGKISAHPNGFGFAMLDDGEGEDIYLSPEEMRCVLHGDRVKVREYKRRARAKRSGCIVEVLERANHTLIGRYHRTQSGGFVIADNKRITQPIELPKKSDSQVAPGQLVLIEITEQPSVDRPPAGRILEVLGDQMNLSTCISTAIHFHGLSDAAAPELAMRDAANFPETISKQEYAKRNDLRDLYFVTIDGEDAQDFDDAVHCEKTAEGWRLQVAIADVSHYVLPGTELDQDAQRRATSIYFPGQVIPMLPERLSNDLCSLRQDVDRLCLVCELLIDESGKTIRSRFSEGVIRSRARLTYTEVAALLNGESKDEVPEERYRQLVNLHALYEALQRARNRRGALDFDSLEAQVVLGQDGRIDSISPVVRNDAHRLIEECMIAANIAAACFLQQHSIVGLHRIHPNPEPVGLADARAFFASRDLKLGGGDSIEAVDLCHLLQSASERPDRHVIQRIVLRTLSPAAYSEQSAPHFGLNLVNYTHFTSPIRRYPDLLVHRAIRYGLHRKDQAARYPYDLSAIQQLGSHCTDLERRAESAVRDVMQWLKCDYMMGRIGQVCAGTVCAVTAFGLFVELDGLHIEGLLHVSALPSGRYLYDKKIEALCSEKPKRRFALGDTLKVRVLDVNMDERKIDLSLAERPR